MKSILLMLSVLISISACKRENAQDQLSPDQLNAVRLLENNYKQAKVYNNLLISGVHENLALSEIYMCDSMYHQYDAAFESCHNGFAHTYSSANHSHNSQGMVQMHSANGSMMGGNGCACCNNGGHSAGIHDQMDTLRRLHVQYHP